MENVLEQVDELISLIEKQESCELLLNQSLDIQESLKNLDQLVVEYHIKKTVAQIPIKYYNRST